MTREELIEVHKKRIIEQHPNDAELQDSIMKITLNHHPDFKNSVEVVVNEKKPNFWLWVLSIIIFVILILVLSVGAKAQSTTPTYIGLMNGASTLRNTGPGVINYKCDGVSLVCTWTTSTNTFLMTSQKSFGLFQNYNNGTAFSLSSGASAFFPLNGAANNYSSEFVMQMKVLSSGSVKNLCMNFYPSSQPTTGSLVISLRQNGANTTLSITIPASTTYSVGTIVCDSTHTVTISSNDLLDVEMVNNATSTSISTLGFSGEIQLN